MAERRALHEQRLWACAQQDLVGSAASILQQFPELLLARTSSGQTLVHVAAAHNSRNVLQLLRDSRAELNGADAEGKTPLMAAAAQGSIEAFSLLLEACPAAVEGSSGSTLLSWCVHVGNNGLVEQLCAAGARPDALDSWGGTPLHVAVEGGSEAVQLLLDCAAGVDVNVADSNGATPLHFAAGLADTQLCKSTVAALLNKGADPEALTRSGHSPLDISVECGTAAAELLRHAVAKRHEPAAQQASASRH